MQIEQVDKENVAPGSTFDALRLSMLSIFYAFSLSFILSDIDDSDSNDRVATYSTCK